MNDTAAATLGRRVARAGMAASGALAVLKISIGWMAGSTAVVADGVESAGDVFASGLVLFGLTAAARPPDQDHPYGHGRVETLAGLALGLLLAATGIVIGWQSLAQVGEVHAPPASYAVWPLVASIAVKSVLSWSKFHYGRRTGSESLVADGWNDAVDILSGSVALAAVGLTLHNPMRFLAADQYGGFAVGLIVILVGLRVARDASLHLIDTMPDERAIAAIRRVAMSVPGALGIEKCYARKTGLRFHVDLHLEADPALTVRASHEIATEVKARLRAKLPWVADVLVHVEPFGME